MTAIIWFAKQKKGNWSCPYTDAWGGSKALWTIQRNKQICKGNKWLRSERLV